MHKTYLSDSGHSFDAILFYGHEFTLIIFDIMVFSFVDLFTQDFLVAAIVTYFVGKVRVFRHFQIAFLHKFFCLQFLSLVRQIGGKSNLARKTLIDKRFLI